MLCAKPWEHPNAVAALFSVILLSVPPAAQLLLPQSQQDDVIGQHLQLSNVLETIS
jgi:hypothetical protein